jgi:hypothetical protein|tara:strand:+ start:3266 stop:3799 length:534 start_codon:yes stop_codon:yes gene_type:complete
MKKIFIYILISLFYTNFSKACDLLNVPIGTPFKDASSVFAFLEDHEPEFYEEDTAVRYTDVAGYYCEGHNLDNTDLQVIIYGSRVAAINLIMSEPGIKNELYEFTKNHINDLGSKAKEDNWLGYVDLSIGDLYIVYSKVKSFEDDNINNVIEVLEIGNVEMEDYIASGENIVEGNNF